MYAITSRRAPKAWGTASQGTSAARFVFVSAQLPCDSTQNCLVAPDIRQQTATCIDHIEAVLAELDLTLADVTKTTVYLTDLSDFEAMDEIYDRHFPRPAPARSCVQVAALPLGARVQIEAIACR